ncbi:MAG: metal ABC transporter substrate-binding protein [Actinomycetota bacterium]|nr:metal ABC transporter substrate-binding protein [Actinomycetota bacterium]
MILTLDQCRRRYLAGFAASGLFLAACGGGGSDSALSNLTALATTSIWADVTSNALCGAPVESIIPLGADPHSWEPSIRVPEDIAAADLLVRNGLFLEEGLLATLDAVDESVTPVVSIATLIASGEEDDHVDHDDHDDEADHADHDDEADHDDHDDHADHDDEADHDDHDDHADHDDEADHDDHDDHHHSGPDPHLWMDPTFVAEAATLIADAAVEAGWPESVKDCAADYSGQLAALDEEIASQVSVVDAGDRVLVTNHDAFGRFAERYGFTVLGTILPSMSTLAEANPADLTALAEEILAAGVSTIFYDLQSSSVDAESLAERLDGVEVAALLTGSLVEDPEVGADYITMMQTNVQRILSAIGG